MGNRCGVTGVPSMDDRLARHARRALEAAQFVGDNAERSQLVVGGRVRGRAQQADQFRVEGVAERLALYETSKRAVVTQEETLDAELMERAATLLAVMPPNQLRKTIEGLLSPNDLEQGRKAIDALIDAAFAAEDETGHVRLT